MSKVVAVSDEGFEEEVIRTSIPVVVDFWAEWCEPCHRITPLVEEIASEYDGRLKVAKVDVDCSPTIATRYGVRGIPTLILFKGGQPVERLVGYMPKSELVARIEPYLLTCKEGRLTEAEARERELKQLSIAAPPGVSQGELPGKCPQCGAPLKEREVAWVGPSSAECPYCGAVVKAG
jgi:thioredoxin 1